MRGPSVGIWPALLMNVLAMGTVPYAILLWLRFRPFYDWSVQEDGYLEWSSFLAFLLASAVFVVCAARQRRASGDFPWFLAGMALFTLFVAMEEISWGQRLIGYRPPDYFLGHNYQQELNVHNLASNWFRRLAVSSVILGYGVLLPLAAAFPPARARLERLSVSGPPVVLLPTFLTAFVLYILRPLKYSGEWVELMLGLGFLFAGLVAASRFRTTDRPSGSSAGIVLTLGICWATVVVAGSVMAYAWSDLRSQRPEGSRAAGIEVEALAADFRQLGDVCGGRSFQVRVFTYVKGREAKALLEGEFAGLVARGLPEARARFFLDPWDSPYWIACGRMRDRRYAAVFSVGANRRRETVSPEIAGDDVMSSLLPQGL